MKCVELYISSEMYVSEIISKYNIPDYSILKRWIKCYNANIVSSAIIPTLIFVIISRPLWLASPTLDLYIRLSKCQPSTYYKYSI